MTAPVDLACGECGSPMQQKRGQFGIFYGCTRWPDCPGTHGAHQATGAPLGIPANAETKRARSCAHVAFDRLWKSGRMRRKAAYVWLRKTLDVSKEQAHIACLSKEQCETVVTEADKFILSHPRTHTQ